MRKPWLAELLIFLFTQMREWMARRLKRRLIGRKNGTDTQM